MKRKIEIAIVVHDKKTMPVAIPEMRIRRALSEEIYRNDKYRGTCRNRMDVST